MKLSSLWIFIVSTLAFTACAPAAAPPEEPSQADLATLRASSEVFVTAWNAADVDAIGATISEDAVEMQPDGPPLEGRETISIRICLRIRCVIGIVAIFDLPLIARPIRIKIQLPELHGDRRQIR